MKRKLCLESLDIKIPSRFEILEIFMLVAGSKLKVLDPYQIRFHALSGL